MITIDFGQIYDKFCALVAIYRFFEDVNCCFSDAFQVASFCEWSRVIVSFFLGTLINR